MASPLTLLMPVIPGTNPVTIAETLAKYQPVLDAALTSVGTVHYARTMLFDRSVANLQPGAGQGQFVIAVITEYDGDFDAYIQDFVDKVGEVFDALLAFVVGGAAVTPVKDHVAGFTTFIQQNDASQQQGNTGLYQAYPQTVQQILAAFS
jgi:hypothetical protein